MYSFNKFKMSVLLVLIAIASVLVSSRPAQAISVGLVNFASTANGGSATAVGSSNPELAINGIIGNGPGNSASWGARVGAVWTGALAPEAAGSEITEVRFYDRGCCTSFAPYTMDILNVSDVVLHSDSTVNELVRPETFAIPNITGATQARFTHTGVVAGDSYVGEIEVIGFNSHVSGLGVIGTDTLASTVSGTTTPGDIAGARVAQLTLTSTTPALRADLHEFRVFDTGATNVALAGTGFHRLGGSEVPFGVLPATTTAGDGPFLNDNIGTTGTNFSDDLQGTGDFYGIELASATTISSIQLENRNCCLSGDGVMQLDIFSDTARTDLIYTEPVTISTVASALTNLTFAIGGIAEAVLEDGRTYRMEIDKLGSANDMLSVNPMQANSTRLTVDGDLVITLLNDTPQLGDTYQILDADLFAGSFDSITLPDAEGGNWDLSMLLVNGTISVTIPEPSSLLLLGFGMLGLVRHTRRRSSRRAGTVNAGGHLEVKNAE